MWKWHCLYFFPVSVTLQFTYVETYPDDPPTIEVSTYEGIDYTDVEKLQEFLEQEVNLQFSFPNCLNV